MTTLAVKASSGLDAGVNGDLYAPQGRLARRRSPTTALSCTSLRSPTFCSDTDSVAMNAGDLFLFRVQYTSGSNGGGDIFITDLVCE